MGNSKPAAYMQGKYRVHQVYCLISQCWPQQSVAEDKPALQSLRKLARAIAHASLPPLRLPTRIMRVVLLRGQSRHRRRRLHQTEGCSLQGRQPAWNNVQKVCTVAANMIAPACQCEAPQSQQAGA